MSVLKKGAKGPEVKKLQYLLNGILYPSPKLDEDGDFGDKTRDAVIRFQKLKSLEPDGIVGPQTWTALDQKIATRPRPATPPKVAKKSGWMEIARAEEGVHEDSLPGSHNKRIVEYHSKTTLKATTDETPWCSSFVNWVMDRAGYQGTGSALAKSWLNWSGGAKLETPREGAITVIKKKGAQSDKATGSATGYHVAFFVSATSTHVRLLGGNQGGGLRVQHSNYPLSGYEVKGYLWPK